MTEASVASSFAAIFADLGEKPDPHKDSQNTLRHYSERFSKAVALWVRDLIVHDKRVDKVQMPEARVPTCFGTKPLDVGCLDATGYLALDISLKTFHFRDRKKNKYDKNLTGRFYELLGEGLELRLSYPEVVLVALVLLPFDGCDDSSRYAPSSFGKAAKQFSKIAGRGSDGDHALSFEFVFIGLFEPDKPDSGLRFFDASLSPPRSKRPEPVEMLSVNEVLDRIMTVVASRKEARRPEDMRVKPVCDWSDAKPKSSKA